MDVSEAVTQIRDAITVKRVFGEPYERDGVVVVPVARVGGGGGGGGGEGSEPSASNGSGTKSGSGFGLGFGLGATPVGAYVIEGGDVRWKPALDLTSIVLRAQTAVILVLLMLLRRRG
ncbi:MAG: spore germination protein GerW family protein [Solirubrobacterales bacterium]